nr:carboxymuconolactone decarboxylase family protein [Streptomyces musisoli]
MCGGARVPVPPPSNPVPRGPPAAHARRPRRNGLTPEETGAVLLQAAVYRGVPAAGSAFATAQPVLAEEDAR